MTYSMRRGRNRHFSPAKLLRRRWEPWCSRRAWSRGRESQSPRSARSCILLTCPGSKSAEGQQQLRVDQFSYSLSVPCLIIHSRVLVGEVIAHGEHDMLLVLEESQLFGNPQLEQLQLKHKTGFSKENQKRTADWACYSILLRPDCSSWCWRRRWWDPYLRISCRSKILVGRSSDPGRHPWRWKPLRPLGCPPTKQSINTLEKTHYSGCGITDICFLGNGR